jgi:bile acid:Na+ symporter, BASS family
MDQMTRRFFSSLSHFVHRHFIWLVVMSYLVAAQFPAPGLAVRSLALGPISLPMILLGLLLFNAGLGIGLADLRKLEHRPGLLAWGLAGNLVIPIAYIWLVMQAMQLWHNPDEVQNILVGLALVASMPIAGSSTAWSQNANGNLPLSLGLVLLSTLLSPLTVPLALHSVGLMTTGDYSEDLHELAGSGTSWFLAAAVIGPALAGILCRRIVGDAGATRAMPYLKLANSAVLLTLNYSNAAIALPQAIAIPDFDFLAAILAITLLLCVLGFGAGWALARVRNADRGEQVALMFGLGMNNNGTGLVLASMALADHPQVLLPIIFYNLLQHLVAAGADLLMNRASLPSAVLAGATAGEPLDTESTKAAPARIASP